MKIIWLNPISTFGTLVDPDLHYLCIFGGPPGLSCGGWDVRGSEVKRRGFGLGRLIKVSPKIGAQNSIFLKMNQGVHEVHTSIATSSIYSHALYFTDHG